jgi:FAD/FMN-containing dehydrogenase
MYPMQSAGPKCYFENLPRLIKVKTKYDPENLFNFPLGIPTKREL